MQHLNVSVDVDYSTFGASARAGFSVITSSASTWYTSTKECSFLFEQRMFELSMGNYKELSFTEDFKSDVQKLPKEFKVVSSISSAND